MNSTSNAEQVEFLGLDSQWLQRNNSLATAMEISHQPQMWSETVTQIESERAVISQWLDKILDQKNVRIIFSGAGTSAFIGNTLAAWIKKPYQQIYSTQVESIATTDIVSNPEQHFNADIPTLLVSFARSGDSPESVSCVELAEQIVDNCYHLIITCNPNGKLARFECDNNRAIRLILPAGTNDKSFAMTSSFSSMLVAASSIFCPEDLHIENAITLAQKTINNEADNIRKLAKTSINRAVFLGAGCLYGISEEASLKCLELSGGKVASLHESPLGFRHGPKIIVDNSTVIILLRSSDPYISKYEDDILQEIKNDDLASSIIELNCEELSIDSLINCEDSTQINDLTLSLSYIVYCQIFAFFLAIENSSPADNPCPTGEVNRVVSGVTIYPYTSKQ